MTSSASDTIALNTNRLVALVVFLIAPVAVFSSKAMVPLFLILTVGLLIFELKRGFRAPLLPLPLFCGAVLLLAWGALTSVWAVKPVESVTLAGALLVTFLFGLYLLGSVSRLELPNWRLIGIAFVSGIGVAAVLFVIEASTDNFLTRTGRGLDDETIRFANQKIGINVDAFLINGSVILSLLMWPALVILNFHRLRGLLIILLAVVGFAVFQYGNAAALVAIVVGFGASTLARVNRRVAAGVMSAIFVTLVMATPLITTLLLGDRDMERVAVDSARRGVPSSMIGRMFIYDFVSERVAEKPLRGWGLNSARSIPGGSDKYLVYDKEGPGSRGQFIIEEIYLPLHPHNQALQIWLELGAVGALIIAALGGWLIWRLRENGPTGPTHPMFFGLVSSIIIYDFLSFGAWQSWWIATQFLTIAIMLLTQRALLSGQPGRF